MGTRFTKLDRAVQRHPVGPRCTRGPFHYKNEFLFFDTVKASPERIACICIEREKGCKKSRIEEIVERQKIQRAFVRYQAIYVQLEFL